MGYDKMIKSGKNLKVSEPSPNRAVISTKLPKKVRGDTFFFFLVNKVY